LLIWGDPRRNDFNRAARRALEAIGAVRVGRAQTIGRPHLWRFPDPDGHTEGKMPHYPSVNFHLRGKSKRISTATDRAPSIVNASVSSTRRYLTGREVEKLIEAARKHGRYGHRDATMILIAYRHGLRASELCDLQWHQIELNAGRLHVHRTKRGTPSVHPMQGDEIRALRRLQREQEASPHVFTSERGGPMSAKSFGTLFARLGERRFGANSV